MSHFELGKKYAKPWTACTWKYNKFVGFCPDNINSYIRMLLSTMPFNVSPYCLLQMTPNFAHHKVVYYVLFSSLISKRWVDVINKSLTGKRYVSIATKSNIFGHKFAWPNFKVPTSALWTSMCLLTRNIQINKLKKQVM